MAFFDLTNNSDNITLILGTTGSGGDVYASGDSIRALDGNDTVTGSEADDNINGNQGNDSIVGAGGNDFLRGGQGNDVIQGNSGDDEANGNNGNDTVDGGDGNDIVRGGKDDDSLNGSEGEDTLYGDLGVDILTGGAGSDTFVLQLNRGTDTISDFRANEDAFGITSGEINPNNLNVLASGSDTLITDKISGQTIAIVQGVDSNAVASELGVGTSSNLPRRLKIVAQSSRVGVSSANPSLVPVAGSWDIFQIASAGWSANGFVDISDRKFIFSYKSSSGDLPETIQLTIDPVSPGSDRLGFVSEKYGYPTGTGGIDIPRIEIPLVENSTQFSTRITFSFNSSDLAGLPPLN